MIRQIFHICGPTASGKTGLALELALALKTEIISTDSRQFYRELAIGSAPPTPGELAAVKHHFMADRPLHQPLNAATYAREARPVLENLLQSHGTAVVVGGSPLYARALLNGLDDLPPQHDEIRAHLQNQLEREGLQALQKQLTDGWPEVALKTDLQNPRRVMRALEILLQGGTLPASTTPAPDLYPTTHVALDWPRHELYDRINQRVDRMMEAGLEDEARRLLPLKNLQALQTVGYRELFAYFEGTLSRTEAISEIKKNTRRFAKRQLTWYRKEPALRWLPGNISTAQHVHTLLHEKH